MDMLGGGLLSDTSSANIDMLNNHLLSDTSSTNIDMLGGELLSLDNIINTNDIQDISDINQNTSEILFNNLNAYSDTSSANMNMLGGGVNTSDINNILKSSSDNNEFDLNKIINESESSLQTDTSPFEKLVQQGGNNEVFLTTTDTNSSSEFNTEELDIEKFMKNNQKGGKRINETSNENTSYGTDDINVLNLEETSEIFPRNLNRNNGI